jgi:DNA-damage-inducible protein J
MNQKQITCWISDPRFAPFLAAAGVGVEESAALLVVATMWLMAAVKFERADTTVRARLDSETKQQATAVLAAIGMTPSELIRLTLRKVAIEGRVPFALELPNAVTRAALAEVTAGGGDRFASVDELMSDLGR